MFDNIKADYAKHGSGRATLLKTVAKFLFNAGFRATCFYRMGRCCRLMKMAFLAKITERLMRHLCHCCISTEAEIGPGLRIAHVFGILIPRKVIIGENCTLRNNVVFGGNYDKTNEFGIVFPTVKDNVSFGPGCAILGPVKIGSNCIIGANAVVTTSIPDNSVVGAFRAEVIGHLMEDGSISRPEKEKFLSRKAVYEKLTDLSDRVSDIEDKLNTSK